MNYLTHLKMAASTAVQFTNTLVTRNDVSHNPARPVLGIDKHLLVIPDAEYCHYIPVKRQRSFIFAVRGGNLYRGYFCLQIRIHIIECKVSSIALLLHYNRVCRHTSA